MQLHDIVMSAIVVVGTAVIVLAAMLVIVMSLERALGRPIPKLRDSRPVQRNRAFVAVLICMAGSFFLAAGAMSRSEKIGIWTHAHAWENLIAMLEYSIIALAFSGAVSWVVFAALWIATAGWRIICRHVSN